MPDNGPSSDTPDAQDTQSAWAGVRVGLRAQDAWRVTLESEGALLPSECACCGGVAGHCRKEQAAESALLVPYCYRCVSAIATLETRRLAAFLSSLLLAGTILLTLPMVLVRANWLTYLCLVALSASLPILGLWLIRKKPGVGRTSEGKSVWFIGTGAVICTSEAWAMRLAGLNRSQAKRERAREPRINIAVCGSLLLAMAVAPSAFAFQYPELVVLNLSGQPLKLAVGGQFVHLMASTSLESPNAGFRTRLAMGNKTLSVADETGKVLETYQVRLRPGQPHLFAPMSAGYCFWLEQSRYGRGREQKQEDRQALPATREFWALSSGVDTWFRANPEPIGDERSSGGSLTALRHAQCGPPGARQPADALEEAPLGLE